MEAAGILYIKDGKVLLLKHTSKPDKRGLADYWGIPGGKAEPGETHMQAAIRESMEETGHAPAEPLFEVNDVDEGGVHYLTYRCNEAFTPVLSDEHLDYGWFDMSNLPAPMHPAVARSIAAQRDFGADSARQHDVNGFYEVKRNPVSKVGVFPYLGASIGAPEADKIYMVYRPAEELAHPDCLASFRLIPWVNDHEMLGSMEDGLTPAEMYGVHGTTGEEVTFENDTIYANLKIFSESMKDAIAAGKAELSCGYRCGYEAKQGVHNGQKYDYVQRNIRGNHLALVQQGRMGPDVRVLDHGLSYAYFTVDAKELIEMATPTPEQMKQALDAIAKLGTSVEALTKGMDGVSKEVKALTDKAAKDAEEVAAKAAEAEAKGDKKDSAEGEAEAVAKGDKKDEAAAVEAEKAMDAKIAAALKPVLDSIAELKKGAPKAAMDAIVERDTLAEALVPHIGVFDHAAMGLDEVVKYGTEKLGLKPAAGAELATLQGYLKGREAPKVALGMDRAPAKVNAVLEQYK